MTVPPKDPELYADALAGLRDAIERKPAVGVSLAGELAEMERLMRRHPVQARAVLEAIDAEG
jgi:ABC-type nitrate/sulfonate/bicarbonate transport system substrate-binding protein